MQKSEKKSAFFTNVISNSELKNIINFFGVVVFGGFKLSLEIPFSDHVFVVGIEIFKLFGFDDFCQFQEHSEILKFDL